MTHQVKKYDKHMSGYILMFKILCINDKYIWDDVLSDLFSSSLKSFVMEHSYSIKTQQCSLNPLNNPVAEHFSLRNFLDGHNDGS